MRKMPVTRMLTLVMWTTASSIASGVPPWRKRVLYWKVVPRMEVHMIRKLKSGEYRLYSRKRNPKTGKRRNLGTFKTRQAAERHERAVQYFKRH